MDHVIFLDKRYFSLVDLSIETTVEFGGQSHTIKTMNIIAAVVESVIGYTQYAFIKVGRA